MEGWIKLYRCTLDNPVVCKDSDYFAVWCYLLLKATHKETDVMFNGKRTTLKPGQLITGRKAISGKLRINESKVKRILICFESDQQIDRQRGSQSSLISILNWEKYQQDDQQSDQQVTSKWTASDQQVTTNKNVKNIKNDKNKDINTFCPEKNSEPPIITLLLNDKSEYPVTESQIEKWTGLYPSVDILQQLRNMKGWLESNPTRRKTKSGVLRFITAWLSKEQNRGGTKTISTNEFREYGGDLI